MRRPILVLLAIVGLAIMFLVDQNYRRSVHEESAYVLEYAASEARDLLNDSSSRQISAVEHLRAFMLATPELPTTDARDIFAEELVATTPGLDAVRFVNRSLVVAYTYPPEHQTPQQLQTPDTLPSLRKAISMGNLTVSDPLVTDDDDVIVVVNGALYREQLFVGVVQGVFRLQPLLSEVTGYLQPDHELQLLYQDGTAFWGRDAVGGSSSQESIVFGDKAWAVSVGWRDGPPEPDPLVLALVWGVGGILLFNVLFLVNRAWERTRWLQAAVAEKTAELSSSQQRLDSERARAEEEIRRLARFPQENPSPVLRFAESGKLLYGNEAGRSLLVKNCRAGEEQAAHFWENLIWQALESGERSSMDLLCDDRVYNFEMVPFVSERYVSFYGRDITDRVRLEEALRAVSYSAEQFLRSGDWQEQIEDVLERLGKAVDASRVYVFEHRPNSDGAQLLERRFAWIAPYVTAELDLDVVWTIDVEEAGLDHWMEKLARDEPVYGQTADFPDPARTFLRRQGVFSIVVVPIFVGDDIWGYMGFDDCVRERSWSTGEVDVLQAAAGALGAAMQRERSEAELRRSAARAEALVRTAERLNQPQVGYQAVLDMICEEAVRVLQVPSVAISLLDEDAGEFQFAASAGLPPQFREEARPVAASALNDLPGEDPLPMVLPDVQALPQSELSDLFERHDFRTVTFVDLTYRGRRLGILSVHVFGETREFSREELDLLRGFADQAAQAIAGANLFQATRQLLQRTRQQWQQMQRIIDTVPEGVILLNAQDRILLMNPAGREYLSLMSPVEVGDALTGLDGRPLEQVLTARGEAMPWHELQLEDSERTFMLTERPIDGKSSHAGRVLVIRDVTEERRRQRYLQSQERLATVGQLAAGIAHDFNNIMAIITLYSQALERDPNFPKRREYLATISKQAKHAANLIAQILDFSRRAVMERGDLDLKPFVKEVVKLLQRTLPESIEIELDIKPGDYVVHADPTRLQQALMNLALNARDAMPEGGELRIGLTPMRLAPGQRPPLPDMTPGEWKCLAVSDTGHGIAPDDLPHLFEPFFTTKERDQGTGLGLAQVYGIVKQHGGLIQVESQPGQGTRFTIYLPALEEESLHAPETIDGGDESFGSEQGTILLVEDHEPTRVAIHDTLEMMGYDVLVANTGREALALYGEHPDAVDLVLSDMVMPEMGGMDLYRHLMDRQARVKMMVMTGYPLQDEGRSLLEHGIIDWIRKPFSPDELSAKLKQVMEQQRPLVTEPEVE
ncbi:MAG: ATP-binding protein [Chloroflexota bacterium]